MIKSEHSDYDKVMSILQVATLAFLGQQIPKSEIPVPFADHLTISLIAMTDSREDSEIALRETIERMQKTFNDYWGGDLEEDQSFRLN